MMDKKLDYWAQKIALLQTLFSRLLRHTVDFFYNRNIVGREVYML